MALKLGVRNFVSTVKMRLFYFPALINAAVIQKPEPEISDLKNDMRLKFSIKKLKL